MPASIQHLLSAPWFQLTLALALAILAGLLLYSAIRFVVRRTARDTSAIRAVLQRIDLPARILLPLLACSGVLANAEVIEPWRKGIAHLVSLALIGLFTWLVIRLISGIEAAIAVRNPADVADNLHARRLLTQTRVLGRTLQFLLGLVGLAAALMTFPGVRQIGASLLASAGLAGLVAGIAARPVLSNLLAGVQIALAQPIRIDDVLVVEGEFGNVEEITSTYVVMRLWDQRRLVLPLQYFIENPVENWTRRTSQVLGTVFLWVDYRVDVDPLRAELRRLCEEAPEWDGRAAGLQVTETSEHAVQLRAVVSAPGSGSAFDLRCKVREGLIAFLQANQPWALPRLRAELPDGVPGSGDAVPQPG